MPPAHRGTAIAYVWVMTALAAVAAWPIYRAPDFVVVVTVAALAGTAIALASVHGRWAAGVTVAITAGAFLVIGIGLAVPARRGDLAQLPAALQDVVLGAITGFKDLVTVGLPVGGYRNLLVPALVVFLVGPLVALLLSWRDARTALFGVFTALGMVFFGLAFGSPATSAPLRLGPLVVSAPAEVAVSALALVLSIGWLAWRTLNDRRQALHRAAAASGVRVSRRRTASDSRRGILAGAMLVVAVVVAGVAAPALAGLREREVLRSDTGPEIDVVGAVSPLAGYRAAFGDERFEDVLFRIEALGDDLPERVRIAVMSAYDGEVFRVLDPADAAANPFVRVPGGIDAEVGREVTARITIDALTGIWLPTFGALTNISFSGAEAARLEGGFYYSAAAGAGVETARGGADDAARGVRTGDAYTLSAVVREQPALAEITAPGVPESAVAAPESLVRWVADQRAGSDGAGLAELLTRLRDRGYLSHALAVDPANPPAWMAALDGYAFEPSASGHSLARIDQLFRRLLDRQSRAGAGGSLVAAVGDDEQFAVAGALIARELGFPARVVLGVRTAAEAGLAACVDGECRAGDLSVWIEVQSAAGQWVPADVTPQHRERIHSDVQRQADPRNATDVRPETADEVVSPNPVHQDTGEDAAPDPTSADLSGVWTVLRFTGAALLVLVVLFGPLVAIAGAKAWRRRSRRTDHDASARVVGGWEEYVDTAVDHGLPAPRTRTRSEVAAAYERPQAASLAALADRAVFGDRALGDDDAQEFWRIVDGERRALAAERSMWRRLAAAVSLKSFIRSLVPPMSRAGAIAARTTERRMP